MKTAHFRSLLFFSILVMLSCSQKGKVKQLQIDDKNTIQNDISLSFDTTLSKDERIALADKTLVRATENGNDTLIAMAYYTKSVLITNNAAKREFLINYNRDATKRNDTLNLANSNSLLGDYYKSVGEPDMAFFYHNKSRLFFELRKDSIQVVSELIHLGNIYRQYNDYFGLESTSIEALKFLNNTEDRKFNPTLYTNLGIAFKNLGEFDDAIRYYKLAGQIAPDKLTLATTQNNIAVVYRLNARFAEAEKILAQLLHSDEVNGNPAAKGRILANLGITLHKSGKTGGLKLLLDSAIERQIARDSVGLVSSYIHLSDIYTNENKATATKYARLAYQIATNQNSTDDRLEALNHLIKNSDSNSAKPYILSYIRINDSITNIRQSATNRFAKIRYDASEANSENVNLKVNKVENLLQIQRSQYEKNLLALGILLILTLSGLGYLIIRKKHRKEKFTQIYNTETRLSKKVHDEFANDIYSTIVFTESQDLSLAIKKDKLLDQLAEIYSRSRDIARENSPITTDENFSEQLRQMLSEFNNTKCTVILNGIVELPWQHHAEETKVTIYRVLHELMINMKKHSDASLVGIRFDVNDRYVTISYSDNGVGFSTNTHLSKNGLQNVENRIDAIGGTITFETGSEKGVKVFITYKAK